MSKTFFDIAISLDGFMAGENADPNNPIGDNGTKLHEWMYRQKAFWKSMGVERGEEDDQDGRLIEEVFARTGAYIMGKRMFDEGEQHWPEDLFKAPVYVLTHEKREPWVQKGGTVFYFINDGIHSALEKAKENSKGKDIRIQGGAACIQQFLNAGLIDEFILHISPNLLGSGIRLFENLDKSKFSFQIGEVIPSSLTTHIKYRVSKH